MGIIKSNVKVLLEAKKRGVDFTHTATLGHLKWYVTEKELRDEMSARDIAISPVEDVLKFAKYSDAFFRDILGTQTLITIDNSAYEGAGVVHDLNTPIPPVLEKTFDVVVDSGTLEHVFNFPVALSNCMRMLKVGGSLFICTPANNYMGHGFYQFSPELFYRAFQKENGFEVINVLLMKHPYPGAELSPSQEVYEVVDPNMVGQRVMLMDNSPALLMVEAKRVADVPVFAIYPQQSDYTKIWKDFEIKKTVGGKGDGKTKNRKEMLKKILEYLPRGIQNFVWGQYQKFSYSFRNGKFYKKL